jgi:hypothetical protein
MKQWVKDEEEALLRMWQEGKTFNEIAEAFDRTSISVKRKMDRLRANKSGTRPVSPLYRKKVQCSAELEKPPSKEEIHDKLVLALLDEFDRLRVQLDNLSPQHMKHKPKLYTNLFRCTDALLRILKAEPEESDIDDWIEIIAQKLPDEMAKPRKLLKQWIPKRRKT